MNLVKNSIWNILGVVIPTLVAIPAMGALGRILGVEKFGLFMLAYALVGYASIFDGGLSRAVIREVSINSNDVRQVGCIVGTATIAVLGLSLFATGLLWISSVGLTDLLSVSSENVGDTTSALCWLGFGIPSFLLSMIWFSYLEGYERFAELNVLKALSSTVVAVTPLIAALFEPTLKSVVIGLVIARFITALVAFASCRAIFRSGVFRVEIDVLKRLLQFGGWLTVTNIIGPIMVYFDRFLLSNLVGANKVAFYIAPSEAIARMLIVPASVARALFPRLSKPGLDARKAVKNSLIGLAAASLFMVVPVYFLAEHIMVLWMGSEFSGDSALILKILLIGFFFNSITQVPYIKIQAAGGSKATAMVHLAEVLPYLGGLYLLVEQYSLLGAAIAWSLRSAADFFILQWLAYRRF